jgi:hypothetical protein
MRRSFYMSPRWGPEIGGIRFPGVPASPSGDLVTPGYNQSALPGLINCVILNVFFSVMSGTIS